MAKRRARPAEVERELTRKEHRLRTRDRQRNQRIMVGVAIAVGLALLLVAAGLISEYVVRPNSTVASVGETKLITRDFWKRTFLEQNRMQNQLVRMIQLEQQFGNQGLLASQINQLQGVLSSPFSLGVEVLDQMIREEVVRQKAAERGITVTEAEIDEALRAEVANGQGAVTVPQATSTAEAYGAATATAESWTPTPTATVDASGAVTATATPIPTPPPPPTSTILTDEQYTAGLAELETNLREIANMSLDEYRKVIEARLLDEKLQNAVADEQVEPTEEQVHARHILLSVTEPLSDTAEITGTTDITGTNAITAGTDVTATEIVTTDVVTTDDAAADTATTETVDASEEMTSTDAVTETETVTTEEAAPEAATPAATVSDTAEISATATVTTGAEMTTTGAITATEAITDTSAVSDTTAPEEETRSEAETLALALELRQRLLNGEDFAALAAEYSDDTGTAGNGGDLGWFGRGTMVAPFEDAAFSLEVGKISEPIRSDFGYHLIEVLEKDPNHPKDANALESERQQAYNTWIEEQIAAANVVREDIVSKLPRNLQPIALPQSAPAAATPLPPTQ